MLEGKKDLIEARNTWEKTEEKLIKTQGLSRQVIQIIKEKKDERAYFDKETLADKAHLNKLKADIKSLEEDIKRLEAGSKEADEYGSKLDVIYDDGLELDNTYKEYIFWNGTTITP